MWQGFKNIYHFFVSILANLFYGFPGRSMTIIGVTGTDGKTTTSNIIHHILVNSNKKASIVSTVGASIGNKDYDVGFHVTTPSSFKLQKFLRTAKDKGTKYFVLEVTSHALDQNRVFGIPFKVGVLTNITNEHLDYHKTYDNYLRTKVNLLKSSKTAILNRDDKSYEKTLKIIRGHTRIVTYGLSKRADIRPEVFDLNDYGIKEDFNKYNVLAAVSACKALGLSDLEIKESLRKFALPKGRLETVYDKEFKVVIDFAHTPNAFLQVLSSLRDNTKGRIIHVFGSAGQRDKFKRPEMGRISEEFSDLIVLTSEDPRSEDPDKIMDEIESGIGKREKVRKIRDRSEAIKFAVFNAKRDDLVLITGKAHEKSMNYGKSEKPWDEFEEVRYALKER